MNLISRGNEHTFVTLLSAWDIPPHFPLPHAKILLDCAVPTMHFHTEATWLPYSSMPSWSVLVLCWQNENSPGCASKTKLSKWLTKLFTLTNIQSRSRRQNLPGILSQRPQANNVICSIVNSWKSQAVTIWRVPYSSAKGSMETDLQSVWLAEANSSRVPK